MTPGSLRQRLAEILVEWLRQNVALMGEPKRFAAITAARIAAVVVLIALLRLTWAWDGHIPGNMDMPFIVSICLALFSILMSVAFYFLAEVSSGKAHNFLVQTLMDMRQETRALLNKVPMPEQFRQLVEQADKDPKNEDVKFQIMDTLIREVLKQLLIDMRKTGRELTEGERINIDVSRDQAHWSDSGDVLTVKHDLQGTGLLQQKSPNKLVLTEFGARFADWLTASGKGADIINIC